LAKKLPSSGRGQL